MRSAASHFVGESLRIRLARRIPVRYCEDPLFRRSELELELESTLV